MAKQAKTKYNYQYDSTARAYVEPLEPLRVPTPKRPTRRKVASKPKVNKALVGQLSICGIVLFACSLMYINSYASLRTKQRELNVLKNEKIAVTNAITKTEAEMSKKLDLEVIRQRAADEFGMRKPLAHQIVYIQLPEKSYTSYN